MLVLLPPSEGKASSGGGAPLKPESLSLPGLTEARQAVLDELVELCAADEEKARGVLGLSEGLRGEVAKNAELRTAGARPAGEIYTGVLYDALDLASLDAAAKRRAARSLLVFSGLWGAVGVSDKIPSYRCSMGVKLPGLGALGAYWRTPMASVMPEAAGEGLVLDLRSSAYAAAWKPKGEVAGRTATVRVLHAQLVDGVEKRSVVSHFNKATKGRIVRSLLATGVQPKDPAELVEALRDLGHAVEAEPPTKPGKPWALDVVVREIH
ncbi:peroxide stress protein YaaA [Streptomyces sp. WAC 01529]|uniref:peroxide stress protein YaaA n=1 Tax=Streptomyces sp. WAC 01529 TaxID=2203205 RepID=UPI000F71DC88|nr:peroxide stress protein YaaA [Streptomyces sp. WAC 01529]AZM52967.1 peroxide stress protein YaaA [Streptomyces sp. WAC 01529]